MNLIDTNVNLGPWPFTPVPDRTGPELAAHLAASGVRRALVSHLGAVFQPEPMVTNRKLFAAVKKSVPAATHRAKHAINVSPAPVTSYTLRAWAGK